nr:MerR family transcriptional regulator [Ktedonobacteraceae bacterium]
MDTPKKKTSMKRRTRSPRPASDVAQHLPKYSIGVVSKLIGVSPQMLRRYEEAGLVEPARQTGKNRLYSDQDVAILEEIAALADQGVNAVGIRHILQMHQQIHLLRQEVKEAREGNESRSSVNKDVPDKHNKAHPERLERD